MKRKLLWGFVLIAMILLIGWIAWENTRLERTDYEISSESLPPAFSGFRIAQVSDLHNAQMGAENETLLAMLKSAQPDMIAITGDLIDSRRTDTAVALEFAAEAVKIAPCYYVPGNHEARVAEYDALKEAMVTAGVSVLENEKVQISCADAALTVAGVEDPSFTTDYLLGDAGAVMDEQLQTLAEGEDTFQILLSHRPELFETYVAWDVELVLSGHAHGGQFRLPWIGGLVAPNQGLFPQYDGGLFTQAHTTMVVSRGIGNSIFPFRFCNSPELVVIELKTTR